MLFLLVACGLSPCELPADPPEVGACFESPAGDTGGGWSTVEATWSGTVAEVASGAFPSDCDRRFGADPTTDGWWVRLSTAEGDEQFGVATPGTAPPAVGETLSVTVYEDPGDFGPTLGAVEVRTEADTLRDWVGAGGSPEELRAPAEVTLATGDPICEDHDSCGDSRGYDLRVVTGSATAEATNGATTPIDGLDVSVASLVHQLDAQGTCPDWFVASAIVGIAR